MSPAEAIFELFSNLYDLNTESGKADMYSAQLELSPPVYTNFIKLEYFRQCKNTVDRLQDIPEKYLTIYHGDRLFISHKWQTRNHPDPNRNTLNRLLELTTKFSNDAAIWWDFCCLPQRNSITGIDDRNDKQKKFFKYQLNLIPLVILDTRQMYLWKDEGLKSGWCTVENLIGNALMQDLNRTIYERKNELKAPPLFVKKIEHKFLITSHLYKFEHKLFERIFSTREADMQVDEIIVWFNLKLNRGKETAFSELCCQVTKELIFEMMEHFELEFTNGSDKEVVSNLLFSIFQKIKQRPLDSFKWGKNADFLGMWHYVKGAYGNCVLPSFAYWF